ncbi:MAG: HAD family phosphatase [Gammaproteobacteria bacterium]|nr:HAD family phosphatase [Gammaproteobacteria bacterium]
MFDMDGLLLDSERVARQCFVEACRDCDWEPDLDVYNLCIGSTYAATEQILCTNFGARFPWQAVSERWHDLYHARVLHHPVVVKSGAVEVLDLLDRHGVPAALATSTRRETTIAKLGNAKLSNRFQHVICGGETRRGKPHPDPYLEAVQRLGLAPHVCWAFEDSDNGVRAAVAAGLTVFQVPDLVRPSDSVQALGHTIVRSLHEVVALLASLPAR